MENSILKAERDIVRSKNKHEMRRGLLSRLNVLQKKFPRTTNQLAEAIGVSFVTVDGFIFGGKKTYYKSLCLIERWIELEEERHDGNVREYGQGKD